MTNNNGNSFEKINDTVLLALVIYGEARNQGLDGMLGVGSVVMNRLRRQTWYGKTLKEVILRRLQFSCFNEDDTKTLQNEEDPNRDLLETIAHDFQAASGRDPILKAAYWVAVGILEGYLQDSVKGATHYHRYDSDPGWDDDLKKMKLCHRLGDHVFFREV